MAMPGAVIFALLLTASVSGQSSCDFERLRSLIIDTRDRLRASQDAVFNELHPSILSEMRLEMANLRKEHNEKLRQMAADIKAEVTRQMDRLHTATKRVGTDLTLQMTAMSTSIDLRLRNISEQARKGAEINTELQRDRKRKAEEQQQPANVSNATAQPPGCGGAVAVTDRLTEKVIVGSAAPAAGIKPTNCWNLTAGPGRHVLLTVDADKVNCSRGELQIRVDRRRLPQICSRLQDRTVALPLAGSSIEVRFRPAANRSTAERVRLTYRARAPFNKIAVRIQTPATFFLKRRMISLNGYERTWRDVRPTAKRLVSSLIDEGAVVAYHPGYFYRRNQTVRSCIETSGPCRDEIDGRPLGRSIAFFRRFLLLDSAVNNCPGCIPDLWVPLALRVVRVAASNPPRLRRTGETVLLDPQSLLLLWGLAMTDLRSGNASSSDITLKSSKVFIRLQFGHSDGETGRRFFNRKSLMRAQTVPKRHQQWHQLLIAVWEGDPIPKFAISSGSSAKAFSRFGVELVIEKGRLRRRRGRVNPEDGTWVKLDSKTTINRQLRAAMQP